MAQPPSTGSPPLLPLGVRDTNGPGHRLLGVRDGARTGKKTTPAVGKGRKQKRTTTVRSRSRAWCFTENAIQDNAQTAGRVQRSIQEGLSAYGDDIRYIIFQRERGLEATADHFQGYVEFYRPYGLVGVRARVSATAHWEARGGSQKQAIAYCKKNDTRCAGDSGPFEYGHKAEQGQRTDIKALREACETGCSKRKLLEDHTSACAKYPRFINLCESIYFTPNWRKVECTLLVGATRLGKTRWVYENWDMKSFWSLPAVTTAVWFDGYDGQTHVLIDDFPGQECMGITLLLQLLDGYTLRVPVKCGFTSWKPTHIALTSNISPNIWYCWSGKRSQYDALAARFSLVKVFANDGSVTDYVPSEYFILE